MLTNFVFDRYSFNFQLRGLKEVYMKNKIIQYLALKMLKECFPNKKHHFFNTLIYFRNLFIASKIDC